MFHVKRFREVIIMAYVVPNSNLQLFKGIKLDNRYMDTIYFANESAQNNWFSARVFKNYTGMMYRRNTSKSVKIEADATELYGVTYMRFKNTRTGSKWFYAFVNGIDYVNENTAIVYYEIDVMQTWFMQGGRVEPCMIIREHVNNDTMGTNVEPEPVSSECYTMDFIGKTGLFEDSEHAGEIRDSWGAVMVTSAEPNFNPQDPEHSDPLVNNEMIIGTKTTVIDDASQLPSKLMDIIEDTLGSWDKSEQKADILDLFMFPNAFNNVATTRNKYDVPIIMPQSYTTPTDPYTPKNNKLLTYPYNFLYVTTKNGEAREYRWEYFPNPLATNPVFKVYGNNLGGGTIMCYPYIYNGVTENQNEKLVMENFPKIPFVYDAYQAWIASGCRTKLENEETLTYIKGISNGVANVIGGVTNTAGGFFNTGVGAVTLGETHSLTSLNQTLGGINQMAKGIASIPTTFADVQEATNKISYQWKDARYAPNIPVGKATPNLQYSLVQLDFYFYNYHVRPREARHIDDFFSMFGYAINKVKAPNLTGRQYWNFVQTQNSVISGDMPATSRAAIGRIFDGGITFWHNGDQVGNYAQSITNDSINNPIV